MDDDSISLHIEGHTPSQHSGQGDVRDQMRSSPIQFSVRSIGKGLNSDAYPLNLCLVNGTANNQKGLREVKVEEMKEAKIFHELTAGNADEHSTHCTSPESTDMHIDTPISTITTNSISAKQKQGFIKEEGQEDEGLSFFPPFSHHTLHHLIFLSFFD